MIFPEFASELKSNVQVIGHRCLGMSHQDVKIGQLRFWTLCNDRSAKQTRVEVVENSRMLGGLPSNGPTINPSTWNFGEDSEPYGWTRGEWIVPGLA